MGFRRLFYFVLILINIENCLGQITNYPYVESFTNTNSIDIESVEIDKENTIITVLYTEKRGSFLMPFIYFPPTTILLDDVKGEGVAIKSLGKYQIGVKYSTVKNNNYRFKLYFSRLDPGVEKITVRGFINDTYGNKSVWFSWNGIKINNPSLPKSRKKTNWNEVTLKNYFLNDSKDFREGIYERVTSDNNKYKLALVKNNEGFEIIYLSSNTSNDFKEGDVKANLFSTASDNIFKTKWVMFDRTINENYYISFSDSFMKVLNTEDQSEDSYIKLFPTAKGQNLENPRYNSSGTGFLINSKGFIVTNYHVIKNANKIVVRGLNGDFNKRINAKVVIQDINNDIAIIKTDEFETPKLAEPPFVISNKVKESGNSVFCLGYPLRATMGDEVKITNGIISSNSGFKGDITSYQISAPIQPGNSGGPLFDYSGNLVGVINAKHIDAENVSYSIKTSYLLNLINSLPNPIKLQQINKINNLSLPDKIKLIKKFTYIIEIN